MKIKLPLGESRFERELVGQLERALELLNQYAQVPAGGLTGNVLAKSGVRDYDMGWRTMRSGTATLATGTASVTLSPAEADTSYQVLLTPNANETVYVSAKATGSFTITSSNGASTASVDWLLVRP